MADTGLADPALAGALGRWADQPGPRARAQVLAALATARLFAAVTARSTAEHVDPGTGLRAESTAEMALVTLAGSSGRGIPVFLDVPSVTGFVDGARPVPLSVQQVCRAALDDGAVAVLVDPPGAALVLTGSELRELAAGRTPVAGSSALSARTTTAELTTPQTPDTRLIADLTTALRDEPVTAARLLAGPDGPVLGIVADLDPADLAALAARLAPRLGVALDLTVVPPRGPGVPVPLRRAQLRRAQLRRAR